MAYRISRLLLQLSTLLLGFSVTILGLLYWPVGLLMLGVISFKRVSQTKNWTTLGSARWANETDLVKAGMIGANSGLILGRHYIDPSLSRAIAMLFSFRLTPPQACRGCLSSLRRGQSVMVRLPNAVHTAIFSPTGGGKGVSGVIPFLLDTNESCIVVDFKGENASIAADHRRKVFGHHCVILDPFQSVTMSPDTFNPLDFIKADDPLALDACRELARALVIRTPEEREPHFNDAAEMWIAAFIALVVYHGDRQGSRSLQTVREFLSSPLKLDQGVQLMCEMRDVWGGMLARMGGQLQHFIDKEKASTLTTVARHLRFLDTMPIAASTRSSSFDPSMLRSSKMSIFLVLPPEQMRTQSPLLRLWITSLMRSVVQTGLDEQNKVHVILDEMASIGNLDAIDDAIDKYRAYGIRLIFAFQSLGQLKKCFPNGGDTTFLSNTTKIFFGTTDTQTAEMISNHLGDYTVLVDGGGSGSGYSWQSGGNGVPSSTHSSNSNRSWNQQARRLLKPEEIIGLDPRLAITLTPGVPPLCTQLIRYYEEPPFLKKPGWVLKSVDATRMLIVSVLICCSSIACAYGVASVAKAMSIARHDAEWQPPVSSYSAT